jgi:RecB family endonuclease NucS
MRLIVARCEVRYSGRLSAVLPEALRLIMVKSDGSVMVHADHGGYKPSNWMTPPTVIEEEGDRIVVRKRAGATEDRLDIRIAEVLSDVTHDMGEAAALEKDGVEADLQEALAGAPEWCGEGFRLVRREWPTDIGPVDLMCRDEDDGWIAVEIKRVGTIDAVEQLTRYLERIRLDPAMAACRGVLAAQVVKPQARVLAEALRRIGASAPGRTQERLRKRLFRTTHRERDCSSPNLPGSGVLALIRWCQDRRRANDPGGLGAFAVRQSRRSWFKGVAHWSRDSLRYDRAPRRAAARRHPRGVSARRRSRTGLGPRASRQRPGPAGSDAVSERHARAGSVGRTERRTDGAAERSGCGGEWVGCGRGRSAGGAERSGCGEWVRCGRGRSAGAAAERSGCRRAAAERCGRRRSAARFAGAAAERCGRRRAAAEQSRCGRSAARFAFAAAERSRCGRAAAERSRCRRAAAERSRCGRSAAAHGHRAAGRGG